MFLLACIDRIVLVFVMTVGCTRAFLGAEFPRVFSFNTGMCKMSVFRSRKDKVADGVSER